MKLYRSLIFRELKVTRKHYILIIALFLLMEVFMLLPWIISVQDMYTAEEQDKMKLTAVFMGAIVSGIGGIAAGMNNGIHQADINSGWKRYSIVLPATPGQKAMADLLTRLCYIVMIGAFTGAFPLVVRVFTGHSVALPIMDIYLGVSAVAMVFDAIYCGVLMIAKDKKELKKYGSIASAVCLALFIILPDFSGDTDGAEKFSDELFWENARRLTDAAGSWTALAGVTAALAAVCAVYFFIMKKTYERREP